MSWPPVAAHIYFTGELDDAATRNVFVKDALLDLDRRTSPYTSETDNHDTTNSAVYGNLAATIGPAITPYVGLTGVTLVSWSGLLGSDTAGNGAWMSIETNNGGTILGPADNYALNYTPGSPSVGAAFGIARFFGSASGPTTFTAKYRVNVAGAIAFFDHRAITGQPISS